LSENWKGTLRLKIPPRTLLDAKERGLERSLDTFGKGFRTDFRNTLRSEPLPEKPGSLPDEIWNLAKMRSGVWDFFCWQDDRVVFCESKRGKRDKIQQSQLLFAASALNTGLSLDSFLFVEWMTD
jgi:hypothetical protein